MKKKVSELVGVELDYWVWKASNGTPTEPECIAASDWHPSSNWSDAGPIIDNEGIDIIAPGPKFEHITGQIAPNVINPPGRYKATINWEMDGYFTAYGKTRLEAAMRCFVMARVGMEVEVGE